MPSSASAPRRSTRTPAIKRAPGEETLSAHLRAHDRHRQSSRPLVSVLVGPESRAISLWRRWRRAQHGTTLVLREPSLAALCTQLNAHLCERGHLMEAALACIADAAKSPIERLRQRAEHLTEHELQLLRARAGLDPATDPHDCLVVAALDTARSGQPPTPQQLRERLKNTPACIDTQPLSLLAALQRLMPPEHFPAVLGVCAHASSDESAAALEHWARFLAQLSCELPRLPLGLAVSDEAHEAYCRDYPDSFHKAVLRDSVIRLPAPDASSVKRAIEERLGTLPAALVPAVEELARCGAGEELLDSFTDAAAATSRAPETEDEETAARSKAEAFLFNLLEHLPETAGLFELNLAETFHFGPRPAEIDLASRELRIAIEIDGRHHFTDPSRYRRDRQKDFLLQRHGYLVLRFLAEDVVQEMFTVRNVILEAVRCAVSSPHAADRRERP